MTELTKENFESEVLQAEGLVLVDFWSEKCEPCMALMPEVMAFAEKNAGRAKFCKLDTMGNKRLAISQKVLGLPTLAFYQNGEKVYSFDSEALDKGGIAAVEAKLEELLG